MLMPFSAAAEKTVASMILAVVNDSVITYNEVKMNALASLESVRRNYWNQPSVAEQKSRTVMEESLESLVDQQLILHDYQTSGLQFPEAVIEDEIKRRIRERYGDRANLTKELQAKGMNFEEYRKRLREEFITAAMRQRNVSTALIISPAKIERYYRENVTNYAVGDEVKIRMLVRNVPEAEAAPEVRNLMLEIIRKIETGASFSEMAAVYSEGSQRVEGGDWGWRERSFLEKGLSDIAFSLEPGQRSALIGYRHDSDDDYSVIQYDAKGNTQWVRRYGRSVKGAKMTLLHETKFDPPKADGGLEPQYYYLMKVEDKRTAHTQNLTEVQDEIEKELLRKESERLRKKWLNRLRAKSFVRYF